MTEVRFLRITSQINNFIAGHLILLTSDISFITELQVTLMQLILPLIHLQIIGGSSKAVAAIIFITQCIRGLEECNYRGCKVAATYLSGVRGGPTALLLHRRKPVLQKAHGEWRAL